MNMTIKLLSMAFYSSFLIAAASEQPILKGQDKAHALHDYCNLIIQAARPITPREEHVVTKVKTVKNLTSDRMAQGAITLFLEYAIQNTSNKQTLIVYDAKSNKYNEYNAKVLYKLLLKHLN